MESDPAAKVRVANEAAKSVAISVCVRCMGTIPLVERPGWPEAVLVRAVLPMISQRVWLAIYSLGPSDSFFAVALNNQCQCRVCLVWGAGVAAAALAA